MATKMEDLQSKLAKVQQDIEAEKTSQSIHKSLTRITKKVGATLVASVKDENIDVAHLDGHVFRCKVEPNTGEIRLEQIAQTIHGSTSVAMVTVKSLG